MPPPRKSAKTVELPWNSQRCRRLLRPLTTHLNTLRKEQEKRKPPTPTKPRKIKGLDDEFSALYTNKPPSLKRKYGRMAAGGRSGSTTGGHARSTKQTDMSSPSTPHPFRTFRNLSTPCTSGHSPDAQQGGRMRRGQNQSESSEIFGLYEKILDATDDGKTDRERQRARQRGPPSLLSLCLKSIPQLALADQKRLEAEDPKNKCNLSFELYDELQQTMESSIGKGWHGLRAIVRAHATHQLCEAIGEGIISESTAEDLIARVRARNAIDEVRELMRAHLIRQDTLCEPNCMSQSLLSVPSASRVLALEGLCSHWNLREFHIRQINRLLLSQALPLAWLCSTECMKIWGRVMTSLFRNSHDRGAVDFIEIFIAGLCGFDLEGTSGLLKSDASNHIEPGDVISQFRHSCGSFWDGLTPELTNSLLDTLTQLCSVIISVGLSDTQEFLENLAARLHRPLLAISQRLVILMDENKEETFIAPVPSLIVLFSWFFIQPTQPRERLCLLSIIDHLGMFALKHGTEYLGKLEKLVQRVVRYRASEPDATVLSAMQSVIDTLLPTEVLDEPGFGFIKQLALNVVISFSSKLPDRKYADYAHGIEERVGAVTAGMVPGGVPVVNGNANPRVRWEPGICEWVEAGTPVAKIADWEVPMQLPVDELFADMEDIFAGTQDLGSWDTRSEKQRLWDERDPIATDEELEEDDQPEEDDSLEEDREEEESEEEDDLEDFDHLQTPYQTRRVTSIWDDYDDELCMSSRTLAKQFGNKRQKLGC